MLMEQEFWYEQQFLDATRYLREKALHTFEVAKLHNPKCSQNTRRIHLPISNPLHKNYRSKMQMGNRLVRDAHTRMESAITPMQCLTLCLTPCYATTIYCWSKQAYSHPKYVESEGHSACVTAVLRNLHYCSHTQNTTQRHEDWLMSL
jgi:hypothetical protein